MRGYVDKKVARFVPIDPSDVLLSNSAWGVLLPFMGGYGNFVQNLGQLSKMNNGQLAPI